MHIAEKEAEEKAIIEAEEKRLAEEEKKRAERASGLKVEYSQKVDELNDLMAEDDPEHGIDVNSIQLYSMYDQEWNNLLQDVWTDLKNIMPEDEFEKLKVEQNKWIDEKEKYFDEMPDAHASERFESWSLGVQKNAERSIFLIENYLE